MLNDTDLSAEMLFSKFDINDYRTFRDGSLYQHCRAAWYELADALIENNQGKQYAILDRDYEYPGGDDDEQYAITLRSSRWKAGTGEGDDYSPWYKYDLTVQKVTDNGHIQWDSTPTQSLSLKVHPQYDDLVYPDGSDLIPPHGDGSYISVQSTWVDETEQLVERAAHLVGHAFGYELSHDDIVTESLGFDKAEVHHRFNASRESDVVQTLKQSGDLLAKHAAEVETWGIYENDRWMKAKIRTSEWEKLGFPDLDAPILIKCYYPDNPERLDYPMNQPKLEVALDGKETVYENGRHTQKMIPWDRWEEVMVVLEEILLAHLEWADVGTDDLVADDYCDGPSAERVEFQHPDGRRSWLRKHYESLMPELYREATKNNTDLIYDILDVVRQQGRVTYETLVEETGGAYRTVREHVRRLETETGGDKPGILKRIPDAVTFVTFSSRYMEEIGEGALDEIKPGNTIEDRKERANERRERREEREQERDDRKSSDDQTTDEDGCDPIWRYLEDVDLSPEQLATAIEREYLPEDHVRVRTDDCAIFETVGPPG